MTRTEIGYGDSGVPVGVNVLDGDCDGVVDALLDDVSVRDDDGDAVADPDDDSVGVFDSVDDGVPPDVRDADADPVLLRMRRGKRTDT